MPANQSPIFPLVPITHFVSLAAVTACTTRAPTATASLAAANIVELCPVSTNGKRIDKIQVQACSSSFTAPTANQTVTVWQWDGTTAWPIDELTVTALTPSTTSPAFSTSKSYTDLVLPPTHKLFVSTSVTTTASTTALRVAAFGGDY
jgi:hypothetical protein